MILQPFMLWPIGLNGQLSCRQLDAANWVVASCPKPSKTVLGVKRNTVTSKSIKTYSFLTSIRIVYFPQSPDYEKILVKNLQQLTFTTLSTSYLSRGKTRQINHVLLTPFDIV